MSALCRYCRAENSGPVSSVRLFIGLARALVVITFFAANPLFAAAPQITTPPQPRTVVEGASHTFQVTAVGTAPLAYQWRRDGLALPAATNSLLPLTAISTNLAGLYTVAITNVAGTITSAPVRLTVRATNDPAYPTPHAGWAYAYAGTAIASSLTAALDGTWNHELDNWSGDGRGLGNGLPGGLSTTNGILTIEDAVTTTTGGTFNNRRFQFTHNLAQETALTNANTLLDDGLTFTFRARLTPATDPFIEITNAPNGLVNNSDGKGMFGLRTAGQGGTNGQLISFSLAQALEDTTATTTYNFTQAGLHMNQVNGNTRTNTVDPGEPGTANLLPLDSAVFHEFWITIQNNAADSGTHRVNIWRDGTLTPTTFHVTAGTGTDGPFTNYLALGLGSTGQRGALDLDYLAYRAGLVEPSAFNQPIGIPTQPASQYVAAGQPATFQIALTGTPPYTIQWQRDGVPIPGATNLTYIHPVATPADEAATFTAIVANEFLTLTSAPPAELHLLGPPIITTQPASLTITNGDSASFTVTATSPVTPAYQWRSNGTNLLNDPFGIGHWTSGIGQSTLTIPAATAANAGPYDVIITNPSGSVTSAPAILAVHQFDYGDAPDAGYATLRASDGARHRVISGISGLHLGTTVDIDLDGQPGQLANADDTVALDDEDGVNFLTAWTAGQTATVEIIASTNGLLNAWVDWQHDASWTTPGDQIVTNRALVTGTNTLLLQIPPGALAGSGYARFRFATVGDLAPTGPAADGEVEDYQITVTPRADLSVAVAASGSGTNSVPVQSDIIYNVQLANNGPSAATGVTLTNELPGGVQFQGVTTSQGVCYQSGEQILCDLGAMNPAATALVQLTLRPSAAGAFTLTTRVGSAVHDPAPANDTVTLTLTALEPPAITAQPQSRTVTNGSPATLTVTATGAAPLRYQWHRNSTPIPTAQQPTFTLPTASPADEGIYTVTITNQVGTVSSVGAQLIVLTPPQITVQPTSQTNLAGSTATLAAAGTGTEPLDYQWRYNGVPIPSAQNPSAQLPTLSLPDVRLTNAGNYSLTLSNAAGVITSAVAQITVIEMDFGDAPAGYPTTLAANGARHRLASGVRLGATVDFEPAARPDAQATGDDLDGADDEDGVAFLTPLRAGQSVTVSVVASANGFLNAWLDFNRNTNWADAGEQIMADRALLAGNNNLVFNVPAGASIGGTFARFRFATAAGLSFVGEAANGEVEDYAVAIEAAVDLSIANVSQLNPVAVGSNQVYTIVVSNAGPVIATGVALSDTLPTGATFVTAAASQGGCTYSAGILACGLGTLNVGATATVTLTVTAGIEGTMSNRATVGGNQIELSPGNNTVVSAAIALNVPSIVTPPASQSVTNGGAATFSVAATGTNLRYQWRRNGTNLPGATFATFTLPAVQPADEGAYSVRITNEVGVAVSTTASLTVLLPVTITVPPQSRTVLAGSNVSMNVVAAGTGPISYQWEYNSSDLPGQTATNLVLNNVQTNQAGAYRVRVTNPLGSVLSSVASLTVLLPPTFALQPQGQTNPTGSSATFTAAVIGTEPLRLQWYFNQTNALATQTNSALAFTNLLPARSGNYTLVASNIAGVSTSAVAVLAVFDMDFGDAPAGFPTTLAFNGARHRIVPGVRLGASVDAETNGAPNATATGDDIAGLDDEDGVFLPAEFLLGQTTLVPVVASTNGYLDAWLDFNGNLAWNDPGEQILAAWPLAAGTNLVPVNLPAGAFVGTRHARFRFSTTGGLAFDGYAPDGEVEDYQVTLQPTVDLQLGLIASANPIPVSSNLTYTLSVTNRGATTAGLVWVTNALPPTFTFVSAATSGGQGFCDTAGSIIYCLLDDMPGGAVATIGLTVRANATGSYTNRTWVSSLTGAAEANPADNTNTLRTIVIGAPVRYVNPASIAVADATAGVPGKGNPYPSTIHVTGLTSALYKVTVAVSNLTHDFAKDFDLLLVGPRGQTALLMSDAGATAITGVNLLFDDAAPDPLPSSGVIQSGTYRPSNYGVPLDVFPAPAPVGPYGSSLAAFQSTDPNGTWSLYVVDGIVGGLGAIQGGWRLELSTSEPIADLAVSALASSPTVALGSNLLYSISLTNRGPAIASAVRLTNALPPGVTFLSANSSAGTCSHLAGIVRCDFGTLTVGAGVTVALAVRPDAAGLLTNSVGASAALLDLTPANNLAELITLARPATDVLVAQLPSTNLVLLGQTLTYRLHVTNRGPNVATAVRLSDVIPLTANFVSAIASQGACSNAGGVVTCELGTLAAGARAQVDLTVNPTLFGPLSNVVSVASAEIDSDASNNQSVLVQPATVAADLGMAVSGIECPMPNAQCSITNVQGIAGELITFNLVVTNRGPSFAPGATLSVTLPGGFAFVSAASSIGGCSAGGGSVVCSFSSLDAQEAATVSLVLRPTVPGNFTNVFTVTANSVDFVATNNVVSVPVVVWQRPFISAQPVGRTVTNEGSVVFSVVAGGVPAPAYQWDWRSSAAQSWGAVAGGTNASLALASAGLANAGEYRVRVTNVAGSVTSSVAALVVLIPPTISAIGNQSFAEDSAGAVLPFVIGDADSPVAGLVLMVGSSNAGLLPVSRIVLGGAGGNRTVQVFPVTNGFGSAVVSVRVADGSGLWAESVFTVTVAPMNDVPVVSGLAASVAGAEDGLVSVPFVVGDVDSALAGLAFGFASSNPGLVGTNEMSVAGAGAARVLSFRPATNESGSATVTIWVTDGGGGVGSGTFAVTVAPVNDAPTLDGIAGVTLAEDAAERVVGLTGISTGATNEAQVVALTVTGFNPGLLTNVWVSYTSGQATGEVRFTPVRNASGTTVVSVRVEDGGLSNSVVVRTFAVTVSAVNDAPVMSGFAAVVMDENTVSAPIAFTVGDVETAAGALTVSASASDEGLLPAGSVIFGGAGTNRTLVLAPALNRHGTATVAVRVADPEGAAVTNRFEVTVVQRVFPPGIVTQPVGLTVTNGGAASFSIMATGSVPMFYQWKHLGIALPGATNAVLSLPTVGAADAGAYSVVVTNAVGSAVSLDAVLRVLVSPSLVAISRVNGVVSVEVGTLAGLSYTLEFTETFTVSQGSPVQGWSALGSVAGTGGEVVLTDTGAGAGSRFYRVRVE